TGEAQLLCQLSSRYKGKYLFPKKIAIGTRVSMMLLQMVLLRNATLSMSLKRRLVLIRVFW
ncbi:MAG: hypothetical protein RR955_01610, partial [Raoultibacter sp.]